MTLYNHYRRWATQALVLYRAYRNDNSAYMREFAHGQLMSYIRYKKRAEQEKNREVFNYER